MTEKKTPAATPAKRASKSAAAKSRAAPKAKAAETSDVANPVAKKAARKTTAPAAKREAIVDPAAQLDKLSAEPEAAPAARTRGVAMAAAAAAPGGVAMPDGFFANFTGGPLAEGDFADAAQALGCEVAAVKAVAEVESRGGGFDAMQRPKILYERHVFARCTDPKGKFDASFPDVSGLRRPYAPGTYGNGEKQYQRLAQAIQLDRTAALKAPSWGMFQILGENFKACGFASVDDYASTMTISEAEHLKAFVNFIRGDARLLQAIRKRDWAGFARAYNGPEFAKFQYDTKMAAAYRKHGGTG
ncbi:N-acetylmuramidase family protein [Variovorax sp. J22R133]|uniref:N-acetylmuramidase family protein n=1 Tax=Variovorax brevis TaxID=3053503 RepID=UPI002574A087|nr:N-acetylmuramidase family protein [Variovorax sp. J22R133]MDM0116137.1 N-acetylmuramidase family protein [Variovorax sp. J22R133]